MPVCLFCRLELLGRTGDAEGDKPRRKKFDPYPIGFFHIDLAEVRTAAGKLYLFVAIDRTSKFAVVELVEKADIRAPLPSSTHSSKPFRTHPHRAERQRYPVRRSAENRQGPIARFRGHPFDRICLRHGIEHRLTKPNHPWTNGQVERMNRTIKEATVRPFFHDTHEQLKPHLSSSIAAYNFARRLKTPQGLTLYEVICKLWTQEPHRFTLDPTHQMPCLNS